MVIRIKRHTKLFAVLRWSKLHQVYKMDWWFNYKKWIIDIWAVPVYKEQERPFIVVRFSKDYVEQLIVETHGVVVALSILLTGIANIIATVNTYGWFSWVLPWNLTGWPLWTLIIYTVTCLYGLYRGVKYIWEEF